MNKRCASTGREEAIRAPLGGMREANRDHLHPHEPEARLMTCQGHKAAGYITTARSKVSLPVD